MKERGILFTGQMVRAILEGRKTQTRRTLSDSAVEFLTEQAFAHKAVLGACPYGKEGDRLWVRETWFASPVSKFATNHPIPKTLPKDWTILYRADGDTVLKPLRWRPGIHMPRWASRLTLEIAEVRVERVQEISEEDALSEGVNGKPPMDDDIPADWPGALFSWRYKKLWGSINGKGSWERNPWVWAITFKKL